jgi:Kef-type K+ transport system membrane component KefB
LSTTSLAVVYSVLIESKLSKTHLGKMLMAATFVTDIGTALALSILFLKPTPYTLVFIIVSLVVIFFAVKFSHKVFDNPKYKNKVVEPEIKYIFLLLLILIYFGALGQSQAVLPAFVLGLLMSRHFTENSETKAVRNKLRTVAYAVITPFFFIVGGMNVSLPLILTVLGLFVTLFFIKIIAKFIGVYFLSKRILKGHSMYFTLLMSTGLTFGTIASFFGLQSGIIDQTQFSVLIGVVVASAVIPTFFAQKWFKPIDEEDIVETKNGF